jgi:hypothetical protein
MLEDRQQTLGPITVLHTGGRHHGQHEPYGINQEVALAPFDLLAGVIPADPPFSVVLTDGLSMMPALGWRCLPIAARTSPRRRSCSSCQVPSRRQRQK